jgi:hypothetical protein
LPWQDRLFLPVDISSLVVFRILFSAIIVWEVFRYVEKGWIRRYWIDPPVHFGYFGLEWIKPWPGIGMYVHFAVLAILGLCVLLGFHYRLATALLFPAFTYVFLLEEAHYLNHVYLMCLICALMIVVPAHRALSLDARRHPEIRSNTVPAWSLWLVRAQIAIPYFFGGFAKLNGDWLAGNPIGPWLAKRSHFPVIGPFLERREAALFFAWGGALFDMLIVPLLFWKKTRLVACLMALFFHLMNDWIFSIGVFAWMMIGATILFLPPDWPRRIFRRSKKIRQAQSPDLPLPPRRLRRLVLAGCSVWLLIQVALPLRHFLYPGDVGWTEEGHRFAWRMKLRDKIGETQFTLTDPVTGESRAVNPADILPRWQRIRMATHPDMILQFSHYLADRYTLPGRPTMEVRCDSRCSLNGRPPSLLVDPNVNLAATRLSIRPASWIMPLEPPTVVGSKERGRRGHEEPHGRP